MTAPLRIGFVPGVMADKWARTWRQRQPGSPLEMVPLGESTLPRASLDDGSLDMCFVRLPIERADLHLIELYDEVPVVVVGVEHPVAAYDEIPLADLSGEQLVLGEVPDWGTVATEPQLDFPPMTTKEAVEVVASGTGIVVVPMSVARLHHRKDVVHRPVTGVPSTRIGLAWLRENEDLRLQTFVGIVRGRRANSSRETPPAPQPAKRTAKKGVKKTAAKPVAKKGGPRKGATSSGGRPPASRPKNRRGR